jgi:hypothetical protein
LGPTTTYRLGVVVGGWWRSPRKVTWWQNPQCPIDPPEIMA